MSCADTRLSEIEKALSKQKQVIASQELAISEMSQVISQIRAEQEEGKSSVAAQDVRIAEISDDVDALHTAFSKKTEEMAARTFEVRKPVVEFKAPEIKVEPKVEIYVPPKKQGDIIIKSVDVFTTKKNGEPWDDSDGPPDLVVEIRGASSGDFRTRVEKNSYSAAYNAKGPRITEGDEITISVIDADVVFSDEVGSFKKTITADTIKLGTVNWTFGRISSLVLEFQP
jgi:hypothetical protein